MLFNVTVSKHHCAGSMEASTGLWLFGAAKARSECYFNVKMCPNTIVQGRWKLRLVCGFLAPQRHVLNVILM